MKRRSLVLLLPLMLIGCAAKQPPLPTVQWNDTADAIRILRERADAVRTVSGTGLLTLTRPDGESVRFDAALAAAPPDRLRLRAWKLGRAIFDLTLTQDGLWILTPDDPSLKEKVKSAGVNAGKVARSWADLSGKFFDRNDLVAQKLAKDLLISAPQDGMQMRCYVDPRSLVPRLYMLQDDRNQTHFTLNLDNYRLHDDLAYPHRLQADSGEGRVLLELSDVELNTELPDRAFVPPRRAEKISAP